MIPSIFDTIDLVKTLSSMLKIHHKKLVMEQSFNLCILFMIQYLLKICPCNPIQMRVGWVSDMGGIFVEDLTRFVRSRPFLAYSRTLLHERFFYLHEFHGLKLKMEEHFSFTSLLFPLYFITAKQANKLKVPYIFNLSDTSLITIIRDCKP